MTKKQFIQFTAFTFITFVMIYAIGQFFKDRDTTLASFYSEPKNTIDVIFVGSSHVNSGIIPAILWQEENINAHNVYSWSQPMWIGYHYIKEALRTQKPRVVVVDMFAMMYGNSNEQPQEIDKVNYRNSFSIDSSLNFLQMIKTVKECGIDLKNPIDFLNPIRFHTGWKDITKKNFTYDPHDAYSAFKGFAVQGGVTPVVQGDVSYEATEREPYEKAIEYLEKIVAFSKKEDFQLIFTMLPYEFKADEREIFKWISEYSKEQGIPFLNYCEADGKRIGFDYLTDFSDPGHVNYNGAVKLTKDLTKFIATKITVQDKILKNAERLTEDAKKVYRTIEVNNQQSSDIEQYLLTLSRDENSVIIAAITSENKGEKVSRALLNIGLEPNVNSIYTLNGSAVKAYIDELVYKDMTVRKNGDEYIMTFKGTDYFKDIQGLKFSVYDKVLDRFTFYFYYDEAEDKLVIKDYPAA